MPRIISENQGSEVLEPIVKVSDGKDGFNHFVSGAHLSERFGLDYKLVMGLLEDWGRRPGMSRHLWVEPLSGLKKIYCTGQGVVELMRIFPQKFEDERLRLIKLAGQMQPDAALEPYARVPALEDWSEARSVMEEVA